MVGVLKEGHIFGKFDPEGFSFNIQLRLFFSDFIEESCQEFDINLHILVLHLQVFDLDKHLEKD